MQFHVSWHITLQKIWKVNGFFILKRRKSYDYISESKTKYAIICGFNAPNGYLAK